MRKERHIITRITFMLFRIFLITFIIMKVMQPRESEPEYSITNVLTYIFTPNYHE